MFLSFITLDLRVVPHNKKILLDWDGHCNVEYAGSAKGVLYMYGYLFKGQKKVSLFLESNREEDEIEDEIQNFIRGRFLCAMDSCWRFFGFQTYPSAYPKVSKNYYYDMLMRYESMIFFGICN